MQNGFIFDNIYVGHSEADAKSLAVESWAVKVAEEKVREPEKKKMEEVATTTADSLLAQARGVFDQGSHFLLHELPIQVTRFITLAKKDAVGAVKSLPHVAGLLVCACLIPILFILMIVSSSSSASPAAVKEGEKKKKKKSGDDGGVGVGVGEGAVKASGVEKSSVTKRANAKKE
jgi:calnexin